MNKRISPKIVSVFARIWMGFPLFTLFIYLYFLEIGGAGLVKLALSPWYWFVCLSTLISGYILMQVTWYSWILFFISNIIVGHHTIWTAVYLGNTAHKLFYLSPLFLLQFIGFLLVSRSLKVPYFSPKVKWWESDPRFKMSIPAKMTFANQKQEIPNSFDNTNVEIMDISRGGCFVKYNWAQGYQLDLKIQFQIFQESVEIGGKIVWFTESTVSHPKGVGIRFEKLNRKTKQQLKSITNQLRHITMKQSRSLEKLNWQEYLDKEKEYYQNHSPKNVPSKTQKLS